MGQLGILGGCYSGARYSLSHQGLLLDSKYDSYCCFNLEPNCIVLSVLVNGKGCLLSLLSCNESEERISWFFDCKYGCWQCCFMCL